MTRPTISVVMSAYQSASLIGDALGTVLTQDPAPDEIVLVDDGSTDGTVDVIRALDADRRVSIISQSNSGIARARNVGIEAATGEWIALMDHDDAAAPGRFASQVAAPIPADVALLFGDVTGTPRPAMGRFEFSRLWERNPVIPSGTLMRKEAWRAVGGFVEDRRLMGVDDYNLWLRFAASGWGIVHQPIEVFTYRLHGGNYSRNLVNMGRAEVLNARDIARTFRLDPGQLRHRLGIIGTDYGRDLYWSGNFREAVPHLRNAIRSDVGDWRDWARLLRCARHWRAPQDGVFRAEAAVRNSGTGSSSR